jgi:hypothetical protein
MLTVDGDSSFDKKPGLPWPGDEVTLTGDSISGPELLGPSIDNYKLLQKVGEGVFGQCKVLMFYSAPETRFKPLAAMQYNRFAVAR